MTETKSSRDDPIRMLALTGLGLGFSPVASGTVGTLLAVAFHLLTAFMLPPSFLVPALVSGLAVTSVVTVAFSPWGEKRWGRSDPGQIVSDELAGYFLTVLIFRLENPLVTAALAFFVTRFFDIVKLPPARQLEKLHGGWGILADDLFSSIYAGLALLCAARLFGWH